MTRNTLDKLTSLMTAFSTFADLERSCADGYAPTLRVGGGRKVRANLALGAELEKRGYRVFYA